MHRACLKCVAHHFDTLRLQEVLAHSYRNKRLDPALTHALGAAWISSWVGAQISLQSNPRLKYALEKGGYSARPKLWQELPATTLIECDNIVREEKKVTDLVNSVSTHLANTGSGTPENDRDNRLAIQDLSAVTTEETMLEEFLLKEELSTRIASLKLSKRELEVLQLVREGYRYKEIAIELDIDEGTVKTHMHRIRKKAAGQ